MNFSFQLPFKLSLGGQTTQAQQQTSSSLQEMKYATFEDLKVSLSAEALLDKQMGNTGSLVSLFLHCDLFLKSYPDERRRINKLIRQNDRHLKTAQRRLAQNQLLIQYKYADERQQP